MRASRAIEVLQKLIEVEGDVELQMVKVQTNSQGYGVETMVVANLGKGQSVAVFNKAILANG